MLKIEMPIEQAKLAAEACLFYARMLTGDYQTVIDLCLDKTLPDSEHESRSATAREYLYQAKSRISSDAPDASLTTEQVRKIADDALTLKELFEKSDGSIVVSDAQAELISGVCELYARVRMGQFKEIIWYFLDMKLPPEDYCERRDEAEQLLLKARESIYPDLHGIGHSYGIGKFEDADKVYDVHQVIRYARGHWREPFSYYPVPKCTVISGT